MRCSNCVKQTPSNRKVCHWCNNDKSKDQQTHTIIIVSIIVVINSMVVFI